MPLAGWLLYRGGATWGGGLAGLAPSGLRGRRVHAGAGVQGVFTCVGPVAGAMPHGIICRTHGVCVMH